jgi:hypothetical protein
MVLGWPPFKIVSGDPDFRKLQYSSSNNTGNTSIVKHTILEAPVFFIQQYW